MQPDQNASAGWQYSPEENSTQPAGTQPVQSSKPEISWSASEFIAYQKSALWYIQVIVAVVVIGGAVYLLSRDIVSTLSVVIVGVLFLIFAGRQPRVLNYAVDRLGVHIDKKLYSFGTLRSFAVIDEGSLRSITLLPLKRFMPAISMYFEPQDEQKIISTLGSYLPYEDRKQDMIDKFMHKIRF